MCADCKKALAQRSEAAALLLAACSEGYGVKPSLRLVYPPQPVPADMMALAMQIGGQA